MAAFSQEFGIRPWEWDQLLLSEALALIDVLERRG